MPFPKKFRGNFPLRCSLLPLLLLSPGPFIPGPWATALPGNRGRSPHFFPAIEGVGEMGPPTADPRPLADRARVAVRQPVVEWAEAVTTADKKRDVLLVVLAVRVSFGGPRSPRIWEETAGPRSVEKDTISYEGRMAEHQDQLFFGISFTVFGTIQHSAGDDQKFWRIFSPPRPPLNHSKTSERVIKNRSVFEFRIRENTTKDFGKTSSKGGWGELKV